MRQSDWDYVTIWRIDMDSMMIRLLKNLPIKEEHRALEGEEFKVTRIKYKEDRYGDPSGFVSVYFCLDSDGNEFGVLPLEREII